MACLKEFFPSTAIYVLRRYKQTEKIDEYMNQCKVCELDPYKYNYYVHGYFIPWLEKQKMDGKITWGKLFFLIESFIRRIKSIVNT